MNLSPPMLRAVQRQLEDFCAAEIGRCAHWSLISDPAVAFGVDEAKPMPAASVAKAPLVMAAIEIIEAGQLDGDRRTPVTEFGATRYCSILKGFDPASTLSLREICRIALITSDNPLAVYLTSLLGVNAIEDTLRRLGVSPQSKICVGFSEPELGVPNRANVMTAADANRVLRAAVTDDRYRDIRVALENNLRNTRIPRLLPETAIVAHKTGTLDGVVNDAGVVSGGVEPFALTLLTDGQPDPANTEIDMARCALGIFEALRT